ncbi:MAG TPA: PQQ-binding-like beta-propeller repeat protein [Terriglobales bacterium]
MIRTTLLATLLFSQFAFTQDAATFRGNPEHTGVYNASGVPKFSRINWKFHTGGRVFSSPAVAAGTAFVGSTDHNLYAVDLATGSQKWKFETGSRVTSSAAVAEGAVFFGSMDANFYALDAATGKLRWKFKTGGEHRYTATHLHGAMPEAEAMPDPFDFYLSSPAVVNGIVYFGSGDGNVYALNASDGQLKWKYQTGDVVHASPAVANGVVFVGSWDSYFYALDAATGALKWKFKTGEDPKIHNQVGIQSSAAIVDGTVYFGCRDSNLYAVDAATGEKKWAYSNKGSWVIGSPAVQNGRVYFATSDSALFHALDAKTGAPLYSLTFTWPMFSSPAIAGNMLYMGTHEGKLQAIDLSTQKPAWNFQTDASKEFGPQYTNAQGRPKYEAAFRDFFYDDVIVGVDRLLSVGAILSSPVVGDGVIYFGSADGNLYAIE